MATNTRGDADVHDSSLWPPRSDLGIIRERRPWFLRGKIGDRLNTSAWARSCGVPRDHGRPSPCLAWAPLGLDRSVRAVVAVRRPARWPWLAPDAPATSALDSLRASRSPKASGTDFPLTGRSPWPDPADARRAARDPSHAKDMSVAAASRIHYWKHHREIMLGVTRRRGRRSRRRRRLRKRRDELALTAFVGERRRADVVEVDAVGPAPVSLLDLVRDVVGWPVIANVSTISSVISSAIPAMSPFAIFSCSFGGVSPSRASRRSCA